MIHIADYLKACVTKIFNVDGFEIYARKILKNSTITKL